MSVGHSQTLEEKERKTMLTNARRRREQRAVIGGCSLSAPPKLSAHTAEFGISLGQK